MTFTLVVGAAPLPGHEPFYRELLAAASHVAAADAAGEWCVGLGRVPDVVVGDFDGAREGAPERLSALGAAVEVHSPSKDETDLELAVARALATWDCPVVLTAAFSERIDHTLAALGALVRAGAGARAEEPSWTAYVCRPGEPQELILEPGAIVSVVPLTEAPLLTIDGAQWPLVGVPVPLLSGRGVSNRALGGRFAASATNGMAAIIVLKP
jgi:thiamine pyrophosphokinase